jgi:hypothetical protein
MKTKYQVICTMLLFLNGINAQKMELERMSFLGGFTFSSFIFKDPQLLIKNQYNYKTSTALGTNFDLSIKKHVIRPEILYRRVGSRSEVNNLKLDWRLSYLDLNIGYLYKVFDNEKITIAPGLCYGIGYMMEGQQYIGQTRYDALDGNFLKRYDLTTSFLLNFSFKLTDNLNFFGEYRFGLSLLNLEKDDNQKTRNMFHIIGAGLSMKMNSNKK